MKIKSVQSINQCQSVIQTSYDIVKAHGGELKVETKHIEGLPAEALPAGQAGSAQAGSEFIIQLPI